MIRTKTLFIILASMLLMLILSACERPVPGGPTPATSTPVVGVTAIPPTVPPSATVISPPPASPTPDLGPTATPLPPAPTATTPPVAATQAPVVTAAPCTQQTHVVQAGENLFRISLRYGVTVQAIATANNIVNVNLIYPGQVLIIPCPGTGGVPPTNPPTVTTYVVQPGDNLFRIGLRYGCSAYQLAQYNGIPDINRIYVGQVIRIPQC